MIKTPFIFLSKNFAGNIVDESGADVSAQLANIDTAALPFSFTFFFSDVWGNIKNQTVDTLILQDTNIKNLQIYAADSAGNYSEFINLQDNDGDTVMYTAPAPVTASSLRVVVPAAGNPQQIRAAKIGVYAHLANLCALTSADFKRDTKQGNFRTLAGNLVFYGDYEKWTAKIKIENLPAAQFSALDAAIKADNILTVIPFKNFAPAAIYESYINPEFSFSLDRKTELYDATLEAQEL